MQFIRSWYIHGKINQGNWTVEFFLKMFHFVILRTGVKRLQEKFNSPAALIYFSADMAVQPRFLMCFTMCAKYLITYTYGELCVGSSCHPGVLYINQLLNDTTTLKHSERPANKVSFQGIADSRKLNKKCCYNGGTCFLGTFCICPKQFTGRHCEYEKWPQHCPGGILNGEWVVKGCSLCRCFSGELHCLPPVPECEQKPQAFRSAASIPQQKWIVLIVIASLYVLTCAI